MLIIGGSGSGKTACCLSILRDFGPTFEKIVFVVKNQDEPLYNYLRDENSDIVFFENEVPELDKTFTKGECNLIVFDDLVNTKALQPAIIDYYIRARKMDCSCIYLSQVFFKIPKDIRLQANYIIIKKINSNNDLRLIIKDYNIDVSLTTLTSFYDYCSKDFLRCLLIDLETNEKNYRFRCNFEPINFN